jgi:hypothetical protein
MRLSITLLFLALLSVARSSFAPQGNLYALAVNDNVEAPSDGGGWLMASGATYSFDRVVMVTEDNQQWWVVRRCVDGQWVNILRIWRNPKDPSVSIYEAQHLDALAGSGVNGSLTVNAQADLTGVNTIGDHVSCP